MGDSRPYSIQPGFLVKMSGCDKGRGCHLFSVKTVPNAARVILALGQGSWNRLRFKNVVEPGEILQDEQVSYDKTGDSQLSLANLIRIILASSKCWYGAIFLGFGPVEDVLVFILR